MARGRKHYDAGNLKVIFLGSIRMQDIQNSLKHRKETEFLNHLGAAGKMIDWQFGTPTEMTRYPRIGNIGSSPTPLKAIWMLWTIVLILLVLWALGLGFHVAGGLIHLLLVIAAVVIVVRLVSGRRAI